MSKIKDKTLWCIGSDRLFDQKERYSVDYYDGFMYSDCGHIILGVSNKECGEYSPLYTHLSDDMIVDVRYTIGLIKSLENNF